MFKKYFSLSILLGILFLFFASELDAQGRIGKSVNKRRITIEYSRQRNYKDFINTRNQIRNQLPSGFESRSTTPNSKEFILDRRAISELNRRNRGARRRLDGRKGSVNVENRNVVYIRPYNWDSQYILYVFNGKIGFEIDLKKSESLPDKYFEFIKNAQEVKVFAREGDNTWLKEGLIETITSKEASERLQTRLYEFKTKLEENSSRIQSNNVAVVEIQKIEGFNVIGVTSGSAKTSIKKSPIGLELINGLKEIEQNLQVTELLVVDNETIKREEVQRIFKNQAIIFTKDIDRGINNLNKLNSLLITRNNIRVLNLLPRDTRQASDMELNWTDLEVKHIKNSIWPLLKENFSGTQILTKELNKEQNIFYSYFRNLFGENYKDQILNEWQGQKNQAMVDILIFIGHGKADHIYIPTGEKISVTDIEKMPPHTFDNKSIILVSCEGGLESQGDVSTGTSFPDVFKEKGAISVTASDTKIDIMMVPEVLRKIIDTLPNNKQVTMKLLLEEFQKAAKKFEKGNYPSLRVGRECQFFCAFDVARDVG